MRKQFRVWDKQRKEMLYDGFIVRHNNPPIDYLIKHNKLCEINGLEQIPIPEYEDYEAEPEEIPMSIEANEAITDIMEPDSVGGATWGLIDYSNFYGQENFITMQCTGFHDKDGELIWEGDLLEKDGIIDSVEIYYGHWIWNGTILTDFRDFDRYGHEIKHEPEQITVVNGKDVYTGVMALGYQGEEFGEQTKYLKKIGNKYEQ